MWRLERRPESRVTLRHRTSRGRQEMVTRKRGSRSSTRYQSLINTISRRHRLAAYDAHDVSQYVWMQLVGHIDKLREPSALPGWISATTTHRCYEILRTHKRSVSVDPLATASFDLVDSTARKIDSESLSGVDDDLLRAEQLPCRTGGAG